MTQEITEYRLTWLTKQVFRVKVAATLEEECFAYLETELEEKSYTHSFDMESNIYTFMFEKSADAETFKEKFLGESRTTEVS
tara:strand:+ start:527 stop:772 length:246 start_codon:yes stop_codon:yes gene_type:complete